jgi:hypothetical protein
MSLVLANEYVCDLGAAVFVCPSHEEYLLGESVKICDFMNSLLSNRCQGLFGEAAKG